MKFFVFVLIIAALAWFEFAHAEQAVRCTTIHDSMAEYTTCSDGSRQVTTSTGGNRYTTVTPPSPPFLTERPSREWNSQ